MNRLRLFNCPFLGLITWLLASASVSGATNSAVIRLGSSSGFPGLSAGLPLSLQHTGDVSGVQLDVLYDPQELTSAGVFASGLSNSIVVRSREISPGVHRVLVYDKGLTAFQTNQSLGKMEFAVSATMVSGVAIAHPTNTIAAKTNALATTPLNSVPGVVNIVPLFRDVDGGFHMLLAVASNRNYAVQATTNFVEWANIATNFATFDYLIAADSAAGSYPMRFYRALWLPSVGSAITAPQMLSGNQIYFGYATAAGKSYVLQSSTNLTAWSSLTTNLASASALSFTNLITPGVAKQFFRIMELP